MWVHRQRSSSSFHNPLLNRSTVDLLQIAAAVCHARLAVLYLDDKAALTSVPLAPVDGYEIDSVAVVDGGSHGRGRLAVFDGERRGLTQYERGLLVQIAAQISRLIEIDDQQDLAGVLLNVITVGAYIIENGRFSYVNEKFAATLGYTREEILAMASVSEIIVEEQREFVEEMIRRRAAGDRREVRYVTQVLSRDGAIVDAEVHGSVLEIDGRQLIVGAAVDMTGQVRASQRLLEREEYFRALSERGSDVIVILDRDGRRTYVSSSVEPILGYKPEELIGENHFALVHDDDREAVVAAFKQLIAEEQAPVTLSSYRFKRKDGAWRVLESVAANLTKQWPVRGIVLNIRDITERMRIEHELGQLQRLNSLGRMAGHVAHDFNNVLMGIQPVADIIRRRAGDDAQLLRAAELITASIGRGKRLTTEILRFGRPAELALKPVDVQEVVRLVADEVRPMLREDIKLDLQLSEAPLYANADATQLSLVLTNLALNAKDALETKRGGSLAITVSPGKKLDMSSCDGDDFIHIAISDTGQGISAADLPHIFEPLFTTKRGGTGIGLSVVLKVVTAHHGSIRVDTKPGEGTTFHVFVPVVPAEPSQVEPVDRPPARSAGKETRVLLVEDDEAVATGLIWTLESEEVTMHFARTGADVLPAIVRFKPDVVVLALSLPDEDGRSVYQRMTPMFAGPVIFSSGNAPEHEIAALLRNPRTAFLLKPYSTRDLLRIINELLDIDRDPEDAPFEPGGELPDSG